MLLDDVKHETEPDGFAIGSGIPCSQIGRVSRFKVTVSDFSFFYRPPDICCRHFDFR